MRTITDMGGPLVTTDLSSGVSTNIGRYGVWEDTHQHKAEVIAVGDDLEELQNEYGPGLEVIVLESIKLGVGAS